MIKLIKKAEATKVQFNLNDKVYFTKSWNDGRVGGSYRVEGTVVKVNRVTVDIETDGGNVYRASKNEVKFC
jgi:hypothetical protein